MPKKKKTKREFIVYPPIDAEAELTRLLQEEFDKVIVEQLKEEMARDKSQDLFNKSRNVKRD